MIIARVHGIGDSIRLRSSEWGLAAILACWGWLLLLPSETFTLPSMVRLAALAPEWLWGIACLVLGGARVVVLIINGAWRKSPHVRAALSFVSCFVWCQISLGLLGGDPIPTGLAVYPILLTMDVYNVFRASADARMSDEAQRNGPLS